MMGFAPLHRYRDFAAALRMRGTLRVRERWPREHMERYQRGRVSELVEYARQHSPYYKALYQGLAPGKAVLETLPVVTKAAMMEHFDAFVTDRRLRLAELERHLQRLQGDGLYEDEFRILASSGSTGGRGIYVFDRAEWIQVLAGALRWTEFVGVKPTLPRRTRVALIAAPDAKHMTHRGSLSVDVGLFKTLRLSATQALPELVERLNCFQPDAVNGYPSIVALLAAEQREGRLRISPRVVCTSSELRTEEMTERIAAAWGSEPFNCLGLTETGISASDCSCHEGLHIFEDLAIFEVVDERNRPVPSGERGAKVLVTSLFRRVQPIIRFEVSDLVAVSDEPCACGRTLRRISVLAGRSDDVLDLPATGGGRMKVHPIHLRSPLAAIPAITQYQILHEEQKLDVRVVLSRDVASQPICADVRGKLERKLAELGVTGITVDVRALDCIEREAGAGKFKLVKIRQRAAQ